MIHVLIQNNAPTDFLIFSPCSSLHSSSRLYFSLSLFSSRKPDSFSVRSGAFVGVYLVFDIKLFTPGIFPRIFSAIMLRFNHQSSGEGKVHAMWKYRSTILDLGSRWRWVVSFTPQPFYRGEKVPGLHWIGGWIGPRARLYAVEEKILFPLWNRTPVVQSVACRYTDWAVGTT
jgi:hypothetical protein